MATYTNDAQQRIIHLIEILAGSEYTGMSLKDISDSLKTTNTTTFRDLKNLEEIGWVFQLNSTNWIMTSKAAEPLKAISENVHRLMSAANRINKDYLQGEIN